MCCILRKEHVCTASMVSPSVTQCQLCSTWDSCLQLSFGCSRPVACGLCMYICSVLCTSVEPHWVWCLSVLMKLSQTWRPEGCVWANDLWNQCGKYRSKTDQLFWIWGCYCGLDVSLLCSTVSSFQRFFHLPKYFVSIMLYVIESWLYAK